MCTYAFLIRANAKELCECDEIAGEIKNTVTIISPLLHVRTVQHSLHQNHYVQGGKVTDYGVGERKWQAGISTQQH